MAAQIGFGWGKGRRRVITTTPLIKTIVRDDALTEALARQQRWGDTHDAMTQAVQDLKQQREDETARLTLENTELRRRLKMAKARLRSGSR